MARRAPTHHVNQAEVEGAIANYFNVPVTTPGMSEIARAVFVDVQQAARGNPAAWRSVMLSVLANHIGRAQGLVGGSELQRQIQIMRASNRTSAEFAQARLRVQALVAAMGGWSRVARAVDSGEWTTNSNTYMALGGGYAAGGLPIEMRRLLGRYDAYHVAAVGNYLSGLGMHQHEVHQYAGFFVGSSETVRHAIRDHVRNGAALTDEHVTSAADARAIMGAIRAGRIRPEDAPPSVRRLMERMEREGIDPSTADPSRIQQFFDQNPNALEEARRANTADITAQTGVITQALLTENQRLVQLRGGARREPSIETATPTPDPPQPPERPPPRAASTLDLS